MLQTKGWWYPLFLLRLNPKNEIRSAMHEICYWNRKNNTEEIEKVYGDRSLNWIYGTGLGRFLGDTFLSRKPISQIVGAYYSSKRSAKKIKPFIENFQIPMEIYKDVPFESFNDFFIREFKPGQRPFPKNKNSLGAFAEARYLAYESVDKNQKFPVKGQYLTADQILQKSDIAQDFKDGTIIIARLCPVDYHRFHFPDSGKVSSSYRISGQFHSVNPLALNHRQNIFAVNERHVSILHTDHFGKMAYVEVGALCVGKIIQSYSGKSFSQGQEKGYFLFGASTVIVFLQKNTLTLSSDLKENSLKGQECLIQLGDVLGTTISNEYK